MYISLPEADAIAIACNAELYEDYSGRFMYGAKCIGFVVEGGRAESRVTVAIAKVLNDTSTNVMLGKLTTDDMGLGTIVYFPGIELEP